MAKRVRPLEELPDEYVEQRLLLRRALPEPEETKRARGGDSEGDDGEDDEEEDEEEEEDDEEEHWDEEDEEEDGLFPRETVSSSLFAHAVAINGEAEFLERRVRSMAAAMATRLPDDDPVFAVPFAEGDSEDRLRYCTEMIPLLLDRIEQQKK